MNRRAKRVSRQAASEAATATETKSIINPFVDGFCSGGLSLFIAVYVILFGLLSGADISQLSMTLGIYLVADVLVNGPHFMASYRLLYQRKDNFQKHPIVTVAMPILAVVFISYVAWRCYATPEQTAERPLLIIAGLGWIAPLFLGWHYMGQSWGMTASFSYLSGFRMAPGERRMIRSGFHMLFVYHVALAFAAMGFFQMRFAENEIGTRAMDGLVTACRIGAIATFGLGLWGFRRMSRREGKPIAIRMWIPWLATFSWYAMVDFDASSLVLVQGFHALQYLMFPMRVEVNHQPSPNHLWRHMLVYYIALVALGLVGFHWGDMFTVSASWLPLVSATAIVLNLHHYFIDAVVWKIRDPEVRKSLFGHLASAD